MQAFNVQADFINNTCQDFDMIFLASMGSTHDCEFPVCKSIVPGCSAQNYIESQERLRCGSKIGKFPGVSHGSRDLALIVDDNDVAPVNTFYHGTSENV